MDKKEVVQQYVEKLITETIVGDLSSEAKDNQDMYMDVKNIQYMAINELSPNDISALIITYNVFGYDTLGKKYPLFGEDDMLVRGVLNAAMTLSYEDTVILKSDGTSSKEINGWFTNEITAFMKDLRNVKLPVKNSTLNGIRVHPKLPLDVIKPKFWQAVNKNVLKPIYVLVHDVLYDQYISKKDGLLEKENFFQISITDVKMVLDKSWGVELLLQVTDVKEKKVVLRTPLIVDTKFIYNVEEYRESLLEIVKIMLEGHISKLEPYTFDKNTLSFKEFTNLPNDTDKILADEKQTARVMERIQTVLEKHAEDRVVNKSTFKYNILSLEVVSTVDNKVHTIYLGGNGILYDNQLYYRNGDEKQNDRVLASKRMSKVYGPQLLWIELLNCYDFRRKVGEK